MYQVYRIDTYDAEANSHKIGIRSENWFLRKDKTFEDKEVAKEYVRIQNRKFSVLPTYIYRMSEDEKEKFIDEFCFSDDTPYLNERRYYLQSVPTKKLVDRLKKDGISVTI